MFFSAFASTTYAVPSMAHSLAPSTGGFNTSACEQLNVQRNIDTHRQWQVTRAVLCDTQPAACVTEMLFSHEFYWSEKQAAANGGIKCAKWRRDEDWPTTDPHLLRSPDLGGLWEEVLQHMPNRTLWLHGDSIMTQVCEASICSLFRSGVVAQPPLCTHGRHPRTPACSEVDALGKDLGMQMRAVRLPNGAKLLCSAVGVLERDKIAAVLQRLPDLSVAMLNYGLHYHSNQNFGMMLDETFGLLQQWAAGAPGRVPLWRELSAQHFKGGSWTPGAHKPPPGTPCQCEALNARDAKDGGERTAANQNVEFNGLAARAARATHVRIVPFFELTATRHDMHRRHFCSYSNQRQVGRCCDCTHFCYTPLFWDTFFDRLGRTIRAHPGWRGVEADGVIDSLPPAIGVEDAVPSARRGGGRGGRRWRRARAGKADGSDDMHERGRGRGRRAWRNHG